MSLLDQPQARIPIGSFTMNGVPVSVDLEPYWYRFIVGLARRAGGYSALTNAELEAALSSMSAMPVSVEQMPEPDPLIPAYEPLPPPDFSQDARIEELQAAVARLQTQINDLQQGYQV